MSSPLLSRAPAPGCSREPPSSRSLRSWTQRGWHRTIEAAGGTVARRVLYRASSMQVVGSVLNGQLGVAAASPRCDARPRTCARRCPRSSPPSFRSSRSRGCWPPWRRSRSSARSVCRGGCRSSGSWSWERPAPGSGSSRFGRDASSGAGWRCFAAGTAAGGCWPSCSSRSSRRSCATGYCCTRSGWMPRSSTQPRS